MPRIFTLAAFFLSLLNASAQISRLNPQGPAFSFKDAHLFNDQSLYLATGLPFLVKVSDLNDTAWRNNYQVIYTPDFNVEQLEVLSKSIFAVGPNVTKDGGKSFNKLRGSSDEEVYFKDGQDWVVIDNVRQIFYSNDAGNTWSQGPGNGYRFWNPTKNSLIFYRTTDTSAWQFTEDSLYHIMDLRKAYNGFHEYTWFHQLDTFRFAFEQQRRVFTYDTIRDSLSMDSSHFFTAPPTRVFIDGNRIIREEAGGAIKYAISPVLSWVGKSPGYNGPSFAYSNGVTFYNNYIPFVTFGEGNLGVFRLNGSHKFMLGENKHPLSGQVYATHDSTLFFSPPTYYNPNFRGKFFNAKGQVVANDSAQISFKRVAFAEGKPGLAFTAKDYYNSTDNGFTWTKKSAPQNFIDGPRPGSFREMHYAENSQCLWVLCEEDNLGKSLHIGREKPGGAVVKEALGTDPGDEELLNKLLALNCDTAALANYGILRVSTSGPSGFTKPAWANNIYVYSLAYDGSQAIMAADSGIYKSSDLVNWTKYSSAVFPAPLMAIMEGGNYFGVQDYHLYFSRDSGQNVSKVLLPWSPIGSIAIANKTDLLMGGENGQLYLFRNAATANVFVGEEQQQEMAASLIYFPNPAHDFFTLQWKEAGAGRLQIFSISGEQVRELPFSKTDRLELNISDLKTGIYIIKLEVGGEWEQVKLFVE